LADFADVIAALDRNNSVRPVCGYRIAVNPIEDATAPTRR
jgi:hypothetical protein